MSGAILVDVPWGRDEQAADWCLRLAEGALGPDEQTIFHTWLDEPGNGEAFEEALRVWQGAEAAADIPELIHIRSASLDSFRRANRRRWTSRISGRWYVPASVPAAMLLLVIAGFLLMRSPAEVYETGIGERRVAVLEDGSRVSLDGASRVETRMSQARRELVLLAGRAKFDVARDPLRPFSVAAGNKTVVATGTSFSVELVGGQVHVVLYEGRVEVLERSGGAGPNRPVLTSGPAGSPAAASLTPGRELIAALDSPTARIAPADLGRSLSWESGQLSFDDEPLGIAVERMNRYSRTSLAIGDRSVAEVRISGVFTAGDTNAFVEGVTALYRVRAEAGPRRVILRGD